MANVKYQEKERAKPMLLEEPVGNSRFFNTTGPCYPERHYMLPPDARLVGAQLNRYVKDQLFWVLHAPRQSGKTTFLQSWMRHINRSEEAIACYVSVEICQGIENIDQTNIAICEATIGFAKNFLSSKSVPRLPKGSPANLVSELLGAWAAQVVPKPLIVLFDEVDVLQDQPMVSFLRQLRSGFAARGVGKFPVSVALVGMRDLRDFLIKSKDGVPLNPGSPFNIKEDSASLANFSREDVHSLVSQHITEKGQFFDPDAIDLIFDLTRGQPWLVNSLAKKCVWNLVPEETKQTVTVSHVMTAKELLIQDRAVHLDSLAERLKDPRVRRVLEPILISATDATLSKNDRDVQLCFDLGLVTWDNGFQVSNPIYREVILRDLNQNFQDNIPAPDFRWQQADGSLDLKSLLQEFQSFWRWHEEDWESAARFPEAFPHLLLTAFLQRVLNGGGRIEREYAAGRGRMDIAVEWQNIWTVIEIKLVHPRRGRDHTIEQGLSQTAAYRDRIGAKDAYLVVFDRRSEARSKPWEERLTWEVRDNITIVGA